MNTYHEDSIALSDFSCQAHLSEETTDSAFMQSEGEFHNEEEASFLNICNIEQQNTNDFTRSQQELLEQESSLVTNTSEEQGTQQKLEEEHASSGGNLQKGQTLCMISVQGCNVSIDSTDEIPLESTGANTQDIVCEAVSHKQDTDDPAICNEELKSKQKLVQPSNSSLEDNKVDIDVGEKPSSELLQKKENDKSKVAERKRDSQDTQNQVDFDQQIDLPLSKVRVSANQSCKRRLRTRPTTHKKDQPFACSICKKGFKYNYYLKEHMASHTNKRPFVCQLCNSMFKLKSHLKRHGKSCKMRRPHKVHK